MRPATAFTSQSGAAAQRRRTELVTGPRKRFREQLRTLPSHDGAAAVCALLADPPAWALGMPVERLLRSIRRVGPTAVYLASCHVNRNSTAALPKLVRDLTPNQRASLAQWLNDRYGPRTFLPNH